MSKTLKYLLMKHYYLFLAHLPIRQRNRLINATPLQTFTHRTITDPDALATEFKTIKSEGVGFGDEEFMAGMVAVAVPVFNKDQEICFTIAVHAPAVRKPLEELRHYIPSLKRAATAMTKNYCNVTDE